MRDYRGTALYNSTLGCREVRGHSGRHSQAGKLILNYGLCFSENLEGDNKDLRTDAGAKVIPVDGWIAGCMPRPEAIFVAVTHLWTLIDKEMADGYKKYREKYRYYRANQEQLFGKLEWPPLFPAGDTHEQLAKEKA